MILGQTGRPADDATVRDFLYFANQRSVDFAQLYVAAAPSKLLAGCLPIHSPGHTVLLMTSSASAHKPADTAIARCIQAVCETINPHPQQIAQVLLESHDHRTADAIRNIGFTDLADLIYLQRVPASPPAAPPTPDGCVLINYSPESHAHFARGILATYEQSLDCPLLHGQRNIEDVIAGHQASGEFDPSLWFCMIENDIELGILILSPLQTHLTMELVYIGLSPHARGRGLGDYFVKLALNQMVIHELRVLTLAVDADNAPALHLYHRHGLAEVHRRHAMIQLIGQ